MGQGLNEYDDPYWLLAWHVASHYNYQEIDRCMRSDDWLRRQIRQELYEQDFRGPFVDVIMENIDAHNRLWLRKRLNELADSLITQLDIERLRDNISKITGFSLLK